MKSPAKTASFTILVSGIICLVGCQRSINGSMASGPYAPAGSMAPASSSPLIPIGPINGATRVPPPATGSSNPGNAYIGTPSASNFNAQPPTMQAGVQNIAPSSGLSNSSFRDSLGGMPINDLTSQVTPPQNPAPPIAYASQTPSVAVGSGVLNPAPAYSPAYSASPSLAQQPSDLLRPIDAPYTAVPVPRYRGMETSPSSYGAAVQPAGGFAASDSWQNTQGNPPLSSQGDTYSPVRQTSMAPSTDPIAPTVGSPAAQTASPSLPWRSPTTAR